MTRRWLRAVPVLWIGVWVLLAASVPAGATTLTWSVVPSPNPGSGFNILNAVSCASPAACTAVGYDRAGNPFHTVIESWNGARWSVVPSPTPRGALSVSLDGVSCVSAAACAAVGYFEPNIGGAAVCMAVGYHGDRRFSRTLIESWNGATWSLVTSPNPGSDYDDLYGVSCPSAAACTAVGKYNNPGVELTLVESWNGTKWSVTHSPSPGTRDMLNGVSCASAATCTAAGSNARNSQSPPETLIETGR